jgi:hypothetical protein
MACRKAFSYSSIMTQKKIKAFRIYNQGNKRDDFGHEQKYR